MKREITGIAEYILKMLKSQFKIPQLGSSRKRCITIHFCPTVKKEIILILQSFIQKREIKIILFNIFYEASITPKLKSEKVITGKENYVSGLRIINEKKKEKEKTQHAAAVAKSLQSCPTLFDPRDGSSPGFPVPEILQARTLEWVAMSFSNA